MCSTFYGVGIIVYSRWLENTVLFLLEIWLVILDSYDLYSYVLVVLLLCCTGIIYVLIFIGECFMIYFPHRTDRLWCYIVLRLPYYFNMTTVPLYFVKISLKYKRTFVTTGTCSSCCC